MVTADVDVCPSDDDHQKAATIGCVNAGRESNGWRCCTAWERFAPLLDCCGTDDLCCKCAVDGKALIEEVKELLKSAERAEKIARHRFEGENRLVTDQTEKSFDRVFAVNVRAPFFLLQNE